jgi:hypothetical protein
MEKGFNIPFAGHFSFITYTGVKALQVLTNKELRRRYGDTDYRLNLDLWFFSIQFEYCLERRSI